MIWNTYLVFAGTEDLKIDCHTVLTFLKYCAVGNITECLFHRVWHSLLLDFKALCYIYLGSVLLQ